MVSRLLISSRGSGYAPRLNRRQRASKIEDGFLSLAPNEFQNLQFTQGDRPFVFRHGGCMREKVEGVEQHKRQFGQQRYRFLTFIGVRRCLLLAWPTTP